MRTTEEKRETPIRIRGTWMPWMATGWKRGLLVLQLAGWLAGGSLWTGCATAPGGSSKVAVAPYPLKTCVVSGNELGSMGDVVTEVYEGREVKFCCKPCVRKFHANPPRYLRKLP